MTVLDISATALEQSKTFFSKPGDAAFIVADASRPLLEGQSALFDIWHDRAAFHFLVTDDSRHQYLANLVRLLKPKDSYFIVATFASDGPEECSGLPVQRYSHQELEEFCKGVFELCKYEYTSHATPWGSQQRFVFCLFRRIN